MLTDFEIKNIVGERLLNFIRENPNKDWDWKVISYNPNITMDNIHDNPHLPWDWKKISYNPNLTIDFVLKNIHCNEFETNPFNGEYENIKYDLARKHLKRFFIK